MTVNGMKEKYISPAAAERHVPRPFSQATSHHFRRCNHPTSPFLIPRQEESKGGIGWEESNARQNSKGISHGRATFGYIG